MTKALFQLKVKDGDLPHLLTTAYVNRAFSLNFDNICSVKNRRTVKNSAGTETAEGVLWKKAFLKISQNSQESTCARVSFLIKLQGSAFNFITKKTLAQLFSCEFCEIFKSTYFTEHPQTTASTCKGCE